MFTQCGKCETVFKLSAEVLRAAGGQVRCGRCGEVFNALARLAEDASAFPAGESALEMEARADEILHAGDVPGLGRTARAAQEAEDLGAADVELARLQVLELRDVDLPAETREPSKPAETAAPVSAATSGEAAEPADDAEVADGSADGSMEFTLPPGELDRIFVEPPPRARQPPAGGASEPPSAQPLSLQPVSAQPLQPISAHSDSVHETAESGEPPRHRLSGLEVSEDVRREMLSGISQPPLPEISVPRSRPLPLALWLAAAIVLALTLTAQIIHEHREWLAAHAPLRGPLHGVYSALGVAPPAAANLSAYQLRQWGVTGDPAANGTLRVRASILNTAAQLQPYPLLRVMLANRFGTRVGARDFEPAEYLGKPTARMLAPGERVDATLDIVDPGKDAEGFEIDVCLRGLDQRVACAGDAGAGGAGGAGDAAAQAKQ